MSASSFKNFVGLTAERVIGSRQFRTASRAGAMRANTETGWCRDRIAWHQGETLMTRNMLILTLV
jgi:hypothetical protein